MEDKELCGGGKYWVFTKEFRNLTILQRHRKAARMASNNGNCWWVYQYMRGNPNIILEFSRKSFLEY